MNKLETQIQKATEHVVLDVDDKALMRERLVSYMEHKPIRGPKPVVSTPSPVRMPIFSFFRTHHVSGALVIALLVTSGTFGVSSAADDALPGDLLYPVKVKVNEEVKTVFLNDEEQLSWVRERAEMRLTEASQLAAEGRLDTKKQEKISRLFAEHTEEVVKQVLAVEEEDPVLAAEMSDEFEAALDTHEAVLARLIIEQEEETNTINEEVRGLVEQVRSAAQEAGKIRESAEEMLAEEEPEVEIEEDASETDATEEVEENDSVFVVEIDTAKTESANMRERATYRTQARASEQLVQAMERVGTFDSESDLVKQANLQIESGKKLMEAGAQALSEHELGTAYSYYRRAAAAFQKVNQLLETVGLFSMQIYPEAFAVGAEQAEEGEESTEATVQNMRTKAVEAVSTAQHLLLSQEGFEEKTAEKANNLIKDASANIMRGDIALVLEDIEGANELFSTAFSQMERVLHLLETAARDNDVIEVNGNEEQVDGLDAPILPLTIHSTYGTGTHYYTGTMELEETCVVLESTVSITEIYPEQITLAFQTVQVEEGACTEENSQDGFEVEVEASLEAVLEKVTLNDEVVEFVLELEAEVETIEE